MLDTSNPNAASNTASPSEGQITALRYPVVQANGLQSVYPQELVHFEDGGFGQVLSTDKNSVTILAFGRDIPRVGSQVKASDRKLSLRLCPDIIGSTIDAVGNRLSAVPHCDHQKEKREIDIPPVHLELRAPITQTLKTGVALADLLLPLGKGQRELIVGDRKTGKTTFLVQIAKMQIALGNIVVYATLGKKSDDVKELQETLARAKILDKCCLVLSTSADTPSAIAVAPFTAMTVAEYIRDQGHEVVVILDDLTTHAKYYREISLLAKQFPGRDSYPGDMFFSHARLLERAGNFYLPDGTTASITCLPVAETRDGELTNFIVSNLISITDGHLFFDTEFFTRGMRPAIHTGLSVTRVGKQTQSPLERDLNYTLSLFLSQYEKTRKLSHFGAELNVYTKALLARGNVLMAFFNQTKNISVPPAVMVFFASSIFLDWFNDTAPQDLVLQRDVCVKNYTQQPKTKETLDRLAALPSFKELSENLERHKSLLLKVCQA